MWQTPSPGREHVLHISYDQYSRCFRKVRILSLNCSSLLGKLGSRVVHALNVTRYALRWPYQVESEIRDTRTDAGVCCASIVTKASLQEFWILKATLEMCHKATYPWFVRCDEEAYASMVDMREIRCHVFTRAQAVRPNLFSPEFRPIMAEKMNVMEDAWREKNWDAVIFLDADLIVTKAFIPDLMNLPQQIVLTPHHLPPEIGTRSTGFGRFNGGFALTKSPAFHEWWRQAFLARPDRFMEQACLDDAPGIFDAALLDQRANVGCWRRSQLTRFAPIPQDCLFLHVHLFQPVDTLQGFLQRSFALYCLEFLCNSESSEHRSIVNTIVCQDSSGWYAAAVKRMRLLRNLRMKAPKASLVPQASEV